MRGVWVKVLAGVNPRCALECVLEIMVYSDVVRSYGTIAYLLSVYNMVKNISRAATDRSME